MTLFGLDSTSEVPTSAHHAIHSSFAARYLSRSTSKVVTAREWQVYKASDIGLVTVFEDGAHNALAGYDQGKADAEFALKQGRGIGLPDGPILFAVDFDTAGSPQRTDPYFDGVAAVLGRGLASGSYGSYEMVRHSQSRGHLALWQTYAWSRNEFFPGARVYQYSNAHVVGGVGVDFNKAFPVKGNYLQRGFRADPVKRPDPYAMYMTTLYPLGGRKIAEKPTVQRYDALRGKSLLHRRELSQLEGDLKLLAGRLWYVANHDQHGHKLPQPLWHPWHRGDRFQGLIKRAHGAKLR